MLYEFLYSLTDYISVFNVFRYITFRTVLAILTSFFFTFLVAPYCIRWLKSISFTQHIRDDGPKTHLSKEGTPTMGGIIIIASVLLSMLLWGNLKNPYVLITVLSFISFGLIGFVDDYLKVTKRHYKGLPGRYKLLAQIFVATGVTLFLYFNPKDPYSTVLSIPFFKKWLIDLGVFYIPFAIFVIVGASNAVNLTDGMDGLAVGLVGIAAVANAVLLYVSGHSVFAKYLYVLYIPGTGELTVFCGAMLGACLGFLWYNAYPAEVFMGDVGSLSLGGALGSLAVITKHEIILALVGGIFVVEALSVILQVGYFKLTSGKRIFKMAPLHHHFELKKWPEPKVIVRFWIVGIILALLSLLTLKLR
ncbi:MAG: phospho-N-acetylmuramoyl-pentapeptide-transferase [Thermodesulfovibrio sp.]|nr:phospho-N-acetylmuramoyl-pentapeptide-transferase [Thermodesulfovibrio sp.]